VARFLQIPMGRYAEAPSKDRTSTSSATLIDMIDASRSWEMQIKMLTTAQDIDKSVDRTHDACRLTGRQG
jgi:hypothetical protein